MTRILGSCLTRTVAFFFVTFQVVHCSAGVGRTGTWITIDAMLQRIAQEDSVDVYGFVMEMRNNRNLMVQTEDQYIFIHDVLVEAIVCGYTEVTVQELRSHIRKLMEVNIDTGNNKCVIVHPLTLQELSVISKIKLVGYHQWRVLIG